MRNRVASSCTMLRDRENDRACMWMVLHRVAGYNMNELKPFSSTIDYAFMRSRYYLPQGGCEKKGTPATLFSQLHQPLVITKDHYFTDYNFRRQIWLGMVPASVPAVEGRFRSSPLCPSPAARLTAHLTRRNNQNE